MARSCDKSRPWSKTAVLAQDPKSDPASILSPALVSNGHLGKEKKNPTYRDFSFEELPGPKKDMLIDKVLERGPRE